MNRRRGARLCGGTALVASAIFALLVVAVLHAPRGLLPGDAALHHWSLTHRPRAIAALCRAVIATGTGTIPFAAVVLAGLLVGSTTRQRVITAGALVLPSRHRPGAPSRGHDAGCPSPATVRRLGEARLGRVLPVRSRHDRCVDGGTPDRRPVPGAHLCRAWSPS